MTLPEAFINEMTALFTTYPETGTLKAFLASYLQPQPNGLRANGLKIDRAHLRDWLAVHTGFSPDHLKLVPWSEDGLYIPDDFKPGLLSQYKAGLYYIQEPSAMLPAAVLAARPGEKILDLCAAPGGKSAKIASDLQGQGLLWANDVSEKRTRALLRNLEMTGCINSVITCADPAELALKLSDYFDAILVDAPCSGSGMFRRDPSAVQSWQTYGPQASVPLQRSILSAAWQMLRPGGRLVYSTCSFSICENEDNVNWLLSAFADAEIVPLKPRPGVSAGLPVTPETAQTLRVWPMQAAGDGHFCALLYKKEVSSINESKQILSVPAATATTFSADDKVTRQKTDGRKEKVARKARAAHGKPVKSKAGRALQSADELQKQALQTFAKHHLSQTGRQKIERWLETGWLRQENQHLHWLTDSQLPLADFKRIKTGLFLGQVKTSARGESRFEPSEALALALTADDFKYTYAAAANDGLIQAYLRGETLNWPDTQQKDDSRTASAYAAILITDQNRAYPLGWVKHMTAPLLKNLYPQGWRFDA